MRATAEQIAWQVDANPCAVYLHIQRPGAAEKTAAETAQHGLLRADPTTCARSAQKAEIWTATHAHR